MRTLLYFGSFERDMFPELTKAFFVITGIIIITTTTTTTTHGLQERPKGLGLFNVREEVNHRG